MLPLVTAVRGPQHTPEYHPEQTPIPPPGRVSTPGTSDISESDTPTVAGTNADEVHASARKKTPVEQSFQEPLTAIVFETEDCSRFVVHEELFGPDSSFDNSQLILHQSKEHDQLKVEVELDTERFGFYVDILYRSFFVPDFKLRHAQFGGSQPLTRILDFWTTASQLPSARMTEIAKEAFTHQVQSLSAEQWQEWFQTKPLTFLEEWMLDLQDAHDLVGDLPDDHLLQDDLVQACANMPPLVFAISFTALRGRFARQVIKQFALNQAAPGTKRKGPDVEWAPAEGETANKKQRVVEMAEDECHWNNQT